jgi:phenylalanyl-tRNA synthetase beta subunit
MHYRCRPVQRAAALLLVCNRAGTGAKLERKSRCSRPVLHKRHCRSGAETWPASITATLKKKAARILKPGIGNTGGYRNGCFVWAGRPQLAKTFDLKQPVFVADFYWDVVLKNIASKIQYREVPKYPAVARDLALVVPKETPYEAIDGQLKKLKLQQAARRTLV